MFAANNQNILLILTIMHDGCLFREVSGVLLFSLNAGPPNV
jgi:hypothetical protein